MDKKQRFFIYDSKEVILLVILAMGVAAFAFTLGVHLGKKVVPEHEELSIKKSEKETHLVTEDSSLEPTGFDLSENAKLEDQAVVDELSKKLHLERERTGSRLEVPLDTEVPTKTIKEKKEAELKKAAIESHAEKPARVTPLSTEESTEYPAPPGKFTLQVGSYPELSLALAQYEKMKTNNLNPFIRTAIIQEQKWYRVFIGGYPNSNSAQEFGSKMKELEKIESYLVSRMPE